MRRIFWGFCIDQFGIGLLHYVSSISDFSFKFSEIFMFEKLLPDSPSRGVFMVSQGVAIQIFLTAKPAL